MLSGLPGTPTHAPVRCTHRQPTTPRRELQSIDALGDAIEEFDGGVVIISHDARLLSRICDDGVRPRRPAAAACLPPRLSRGDRPRSQQTLQPAACPAAVPNRMPILHPISTATLQSKPRCGSWRMARCTTGTATSRCACMCDVQTH